MTDPACGLCNDRQKYPDGVVIRGCPVHDPVALPVCSCCQRKIITFDGSRPTICGNCQPLAVDCPTCGRMRGQTCVTWWRLRPCMPHKARLVTASQPSTG